jgi:uncharacterized RDD family membrane protein YckC
MKDERLIALKDLTKESRIDNSSILASKRSRLWAFIVDMTMCGLICFAWSRWIMHVSSNDASSDNIGYNLIQGIVSFFFFVLINGYFMIKNGQTIGKMALKIRIVTTSGDIPLPIPLIVLRYASVWLITAIPVLGVIFWLTDTLFIYRPDRRCIHDLIAGTMVVKAN